VTSECFSSLNQTSSGSSSGSEGSTSGSGSSGSSSSSSDGGTPTWVWAVVGSVLGIALLAAVAGTFLWRRSRRAQVERAAAEKLRTAESGMVVSPFANGGGRSTNGSSGSDAAGHSGPRLSSDGQQLSGSVGSVGALGSGGLPTQLLRTR